MKKPTMRPEGAGRRRACRSSPAPWPTARATCWLAQNKLAEARAAYKAALDKMDKANPGRQLIQMKLDAIGGAAPSRLTLLRRPPR